MAQFVMDTATTAAGWNSFDDLIRMLGYTGDPMIQDGFIVRPADGAVDVYVKTATSKPTGTTATDLGKGLLAAGGQFNGRRFPSTQLFIYTVSATPLFLQANEN